ncbi:hypothetical protein ACWGI8_18770 [Streptomyces sp. NPDC054841]
MSSTSSTLREVAPDEVTVTADTHGITVILLPDDITAALNTSSRRDIVDHRGAGAKSRTYAADSWEARTLRVIFDVILTSPDVDADDKRGVRLGGYFYGRVAAHRRWNRETQWWADYREHRYEIPHMGLHLRIRPHGHPEAGTCYFGD